MPEQQPVCMLCRYTMTLRFLLKPTYSVLSAWINSATLITSRVSYLTNTKSPSSNLCDNKCVRLLLRVYMCICPPTSANLQARPLSTDLGSRPTLILNLSLTQTTCSFSIATGYSMSRVTYIVLFRGWVVCI